MPSSSPVDADRETIDANLRRHVEALAGTIGVRHLDVPGSVELCLAYLREQWHDRDVRDESFPIGEHTATNLIVESPGTRRAKELIVLGAHYDTVLDSPGADDNASAVAVLLEVARLLASHTGQRTARYVAFACEEAPYSETDDMGSQHHARGARERGETIAAMLALEMVGFFTDEPNSQRLPPGIPWWARPVFPKRGNFLAAVANPPSWRLAARCWWSFRRATTRRLFPVCLPESIRDIRRSDHSSFWDQGFPAAMLTDTSYLRNPHYHQPSDTPARLDFAAMTDVTLGVAAIMRSLLK